MSFFSLNQPYGIIISCANVFNDLNCLSGERCGSWSLFISIIMILKNKILWFLPYLKKLKICQAELSAIKEGNRVVVGERKFAVLFNDILFFNLFTVLQWNIELFLKEIICEDLKSKLSALLTIQPHIEAQMAVNAQLSAEVERYSQIFLFLYFLKHAEYAELFLITNLNNLWLYSKKILLSPPFFIMTHGQKAKTLEAWLPARKNTWWKVKIFEISCMEKAL